MNVRVILLSALLGLAPVSSAWADPVVVELTYLGHDHFEFKQHEYRYDNLVSAVKAVYVYKHFDSVSVDMGTVVSQLDRAEVCSLRESLHTQVTMFITVDKGKRTLFCN